MATADSGLSSFTKIFECPVCVESFNDPRILPACGHHFCRTCIEGIAAVHPTGAVTCPSCRAVTDITPGKTVADLPRPVMINELQQRLLESELTNTGERMCDPCGQKKVVASHFCYQCRECLCSPCLKKHSKAPIYEGHVTDDLPRVLFCQNHKSQAVTLYCLVCNTVICARCCVEEHECHKVDNVGNVARNRRKKIMENTERKTGELEKYRRAMVNARECTRKLRENSKVKDELLKEILNKVFLFRDELVNFRTEIVTLNSSYTSNFDSFLTQLEADSSEIEREIDASSLDDVAHLSDSQFLVINQGNTMISTNEFPESPVKVAIPVVNEMCSCVLSEINRLFQKLPRESAEVRDDSFIGTDFKIERSDESDDFIHKMKHKLVSSTGSNVDQPKAPPSSVLPVCAEGKTKSRKKSRQLGKKPSVPQATATGAVHFRVFHPVTTSEIKEDEHCSICRDTPTNPKRLNCKHVFCADCIAEWFETKPTCPTCAEAYGKIKGTQPEGTMTCRDSPIRVDGYRDASGSIVINYVFRSGTQGPIHPNPGKPYHGTRRTAYLPDNTDGRQVLELLKKAFEAKLVFTIGRSTTAGLEERVTWNDILHKTNFYGGPDNFGYPDPTYLSRVKEELAAKGIK